MRIRQTIKRTMVRAQRKLDSLISYCNINKDEGPSLSVNMKNGYDVEISYRDLAHLVRAADRYASGGGMDVIIDGQRLKDWRNLG